YFVGLLVALVLPIAGLLCACRIAVFLSGTRSFSNVPATTVIYTLSLHDALPICVASIMENTNLSKQQQVSEIMRQMLTQAQTAGQYFTNDQIKEMTRKVSAEVDLVHQQTQNQRYGSSHIGA